MRRLTTTKTTTTTRDPEILLAALIKVRAEMVDPDDLPRTSSQRDVDKHKKRMGLLDQYIRAIRHQLTLQASRAPPAPPSFPPEIGSSRRKGRSRNS